MVVVALANRHTWYPGRATTFEVCPVLQELLPPDETVEALLVVEALEQAAATSPTAAATAADMVTLPIFLTARTPFYFETPRGALAS